MIPWLMGDSESGQGFALWFMPGDYPPRTAMTVLPQGTVRFPVLRQKSWMIDPIFADVHGPKVLEFWVANQRRR